MGKMPVDRDERWKSIFRRGLSGGSDAETPQSADALDRLTQGAKEALLPGKLAGSKTNAKKNDRTR